MFENSILCLRYGYPDICIIMKSSWTLNCCIFDYTLLECENGTYGAMCLEACGECISNQTCHFVNGICPNGCNPGFSGDLCNGRMLKNVL